MPTQTIPPRSDYRIQARLMRALAHESRLLMVQRLVQGPCSAGELTRLVGSEPSTVSKHLGVLKAVGVVDDQRQGSQNIYTLRIPCVADFLVCACKATAPKG
jgi:ArsR family transcriptional regulator